MKTNQIFNFKRFGNYATSTLIMNYKQILLMIGVVAVVIFISIFVPLINHPFGSGNQWIGRIVTSTVICGLLYIGTAFPLFRGREKTQGYLMIPASAFEKFLYEFTERIVAFFLLFPVILYVFSNLAINLVIKIKQMQQVKYKIDHLSFVDLLNQTEEGSNWAILAGGLFVLSLAFAGAVTYRKYPLVKTIVFCGAVMAIVAGYFYIIMEKLKLQHPWIENVGDHIRSEQAFTILTIALLTFSLITFCFAYFKLKEKEVS